MQESGQSPAGCHVPLSLSPSHLELCHLLFQIDDELLHPGIVCFIVAELLLMGKYEKGRVCGLPEEQQRPEDRQGVPSWSSTASLPFTQASL